MQSIVVLQMMGCRKSADSGQGAPAGQPSVHCAAEFLQGTSAVPEQTAVHHGGGEVYHTTAQLQQWPQR
jgi:hypothetical protein